MAPKKLLEQSSSSPKQDMNPMLMRSKPLLLESDHTQATGDINRGNPTPDDFVTFFPWACAELESRVRVKVFREFQAGYVSTDQMLKLTKKTGKFKSKMTVAEPPLKSSLVAKASKSKQSPKENSYLITEHTRIIVIKAIYSSTENNLIQLKFENKQSIPIPRSLIQVLGLIMKFHPFLTAITANKGVNQYFVYEISKLLQISNITELFLDGCDIPEANYYILLDVPCKLNHLSVSRCSIDDEVVKLIASKLQHPKPASKTLMILNLTSNLITDTGAQSLAEALRTNRRLCYLNLAGNMLTDYGAISILDVLTDFRLTYDENNTVKARLMTYLRYREKLITKNVADLSHAAEWNKQLTKKAKSSPKAARRKSTPNKDVIPTKDTSQLITKEVTKEVTSYYEKAKAMATEMMGEFDDPYDKLHTVINNDGEKYCLGNNVLAYINLSYNNITRRTLAKLIMVLETQRLNPRKPRGLINIKLEGNLFPMECIELTELDFIIESGIVSLTKKQSMASMKRRNTSVSISSSRKSTPNEFAKTS